jgi:plastocyanin
MRTRSMVLGALAGLAFGAAPAAAQDPVTVTASGDQQTPLFQFSPPEITVTVGQEVRFTNALGTHNVHFDGEEPLFEAAMPGVGGWATTPTKTFTVPGRYRYVCDPHEITRGMIGFVVVETPAPPPAPAPPPPAPAPPAPTPPAPPAPAPPAPTPMPAGGEPAAAAVRALAVTRTRFCTRASATCRRPGVVLRVELTARGVLAGRLERRPPRRGASYRAFGRLDFGAVPAGPRTLRFSRTASGRRLTPGRYRLRMTLDGRAARTLRFVVRAS